VRIVPLVLHSACRVPALTSLFSDPFAAATLDVVMGAKVTLTTPAPHGLTVPQGLCIVDADVPNKIIAAAAGSNGDWIFTTQYPHDLSTGPGGDNVSNWNITAKLGGFANPYLTGLVQLVDVPGTTTFQIKPSHHVASITLTGSEALLERLENGIIGWHKMTVASPTTLEFNTPPDVGRTYQIPSPTVVYNIRIAGALTLDAARDQYVRGYVKDQTDQVEAEILKAWMFITPPSSVSVSKDRNAQGDAVSEITPSSENRQLITDGFTVFVFLPGEKSGGAVACSDLASGDILGVILHTFHGLVLPRRELYQADTFVSLMVEHGNALGVYDKATYVHGYAFQSPAYLTQMDAIQSFEWSTINETTMSATTGAGPGSQGGTVNTTQNIAPVGSVAFHGISTQPPSPSPSPVGSVAFRGLSIDLFHDDAPQPLSVTVPLT
jgi:hypothetical protein